MLKVRRPTSKIAACPYCRDEIATSDVAWTCYKCATRHHRVCAVENRKCTVFGCGTPAPFRDDPTVPRTPTLAERRARLQQYRESDSFSTRAVGILGLVVGVALIAFGASTGHAFALTIVGVAHLIAGLRDALTGDSDPWVFGLWKAILTPTRFWW